MREAKADDGLKGQNLLKEVHLRDQEIEELRRKARKRKEKIRDLQREVLMLREGQAPHRSSAPQSEDERKPIS